MVFERKQTSQKTAPSEVVDLTPALRVAIWNAPAAGREHPIHLSFERIAENGKSRKTMVPETLLHLPQAVGVLASALSKSTLPDALRRELKNLSDAMFQVAQRMEQPKDVAPLTNGESIFG